MKKKIKLIESLPPVIVETIWVSPEEYKKKRKETLKRLRRLRSR